MRIKLTLNGDRNYWRTTTQFGEVEFCREQVTRIFPEINEQNEIILSIHKTNRHAGFRQVTLSRTGYCLAKGFWHWEVKNYSTLATKLFSHFESTTDKILCFLFGVPSLDVLGNSYTLYVKMAPVVQQTQTN